VEVQLDDQVDSKTLLGTYICTEVPGEFVWQPGALTQAVRDGRWVFIEDIDRAPLELLAAIAPLLESRVLHLPGGSAGVCASSGDGVSSGGSIIEGSTLRAAPGFQLFATRSTGLNGGGGSAVGMQSLWAAVGIEPLSEEEVREVVHFRFPGFPDGLVQRMHRTFHWLTGRGAVVHRETTQKQAEDQKSKAGKVAKIVDGTQGAAKATEGDAEEEADDSLAAMETGGLVGFSYPFTSRDLLKWCARVQAHGLQMNSRGGSRGGSSGKKQVEEEYLTESSRLQVVAEAIDCFCSRLGDPTERLQLSQVCATRVYSCESMVRCLLR
jgi:midasin